MKRQPASTGTDHPTALLREAESDRQLSVLSEQENRTVKKTVVAVGSVLVVAGLCYVGSLRGQPPASTPQQATPTQPTRTRIALLNLTYVIKNYEKYKTFQNEIKGIIGPFQEKDASLRRQLEELKKNLEVHPDQTDEAQRKAKDIQRQLEDNSAEAKLRLGKRSDDEMKTLFLDVADAVQKYAASHDFELVLHYNDAVTETDFLSAPNIARKLNTGALMPLYYQRSMDISVDVVKLLNYNVSPNGAAAPAGQPGAH
jgi:Skp family chaperone for outer membrane proteins